jgi:hypothetical protein
MSEGLRICERQVCRVKAKLAIRPLTRNSRLELSNEKKIAFSTTLVTNTYEMNCFPL